MTAPELSVLVVSHQRPHLLQNVLSGLCQQTLAPHQFEVIVSDDGSTPPAQQELDSWLKEHSPPFTLRWFYGETRGPASARNRAIAHLHAPITLFLNDDIALSPDLLKAHLTLHREQKLAIHSKT